MQAIIAALVLLVRAPVISRVIVPTYHSVKSTVWSRGCIGK